MRVSISRLSLAIAFFAAAPLLAQPPAPTTKPQTPSTAKPADVVLTGCLRKAETDATSSPAFVLEVSGASKPGAAAPATGMKQRYAVTAAPSVGLDKHLNHQVALTGSAKGATTGRPQPLPEGGKPMAGNAFEVTALKMISAKCP